MNDRETRSGSTIGTGSTGAFETQRGSQEASSTPDQAKEKATQAVDTAKEKTTQAVDTAKEKADQVADQASTKADMGLDKAAAGLGKAADMLHEKSQGADGQSGGLTGLASQTADKLDGAAQYLKDKDSSQLMADLEGMVRQKPAQSLLVAAGIGLLLSKIMR